MALKIHLVAAAGEGPGGLQHLGQTPVAPPGALPARGCPPCPGLPAACAEPGGSSKRRSSRNTQIMYHNHREKQSVFRMKINLPPWKK